MISAPDYSTFCHELSELRPQFVERRSSGGSSEEKVLHNLMASPTYSSRFSESREVPLWSRVKMIGILFAQPTHSLAKDEIIPNMDYFHYRSGRNINFYCAGYGDDFTIGSYQDRKAAGEGGFSRWQFSPLAFSNFCRELESRSRWQYSGETELMLANARLDRASTKVVLDFQVAVVCNLAKMKEDKAIPSVMSLFEDIFRYAESQDSTDPTWGFSDRMAVGKSISTLRRLILSFLPKELGADVERLAHLAVHDVSK